MPTVCPTRNPGDRPTPGADLHAAGGSVCPGGHGPAGPRALQPVSPVGFKILGAQAQALHDWIVLRLTGERLAGTPSLTKVFGLIGRDLRAAQESAKTSAPEVSP